MCNKKHFVRNHDKTLTEVPCYFIASVCVVDPIHQGGLEMFLRSTYPYYHGKTQEESKRMKETIVPNNIVFAHISIGI